MPKLTLTDLSVRSLKPTGQAGKQITFWDSIVPGFNVRASAADLSYTLVHGQNRKRVTIGKVGTLSLKEARQKARELLDPQKPEEPKQTFKQVREQFIELHAKQKNRPSTAAETERLLKRHFAKLDGKPIAGITTEDVTKIIDGLVGTPSEANHAFTAIRTMFRWAARRRMCQDPVSGLQKPAQERSRERVLSDKELTAILAVAPSQRDFGAIVQLLILTGQRLSQIAGLRSEWIQGDLIVFPAEVMKGGREHAVPLTAKALSLLPETEGLFFPNEKGKPFSNFSHDKARFDKQCAIAHWTLHDLRRTFATNLGRLDVDPHVGDRILAHSTPGNLSKVALIYNRHRYIEPMRQALRTYEDWLQSLVHPAAS